ncbi:flavin reductase (DIM6/NTAB) family NADH-FMN oxidoreductase RutF [Nonlabens dokdonensis]|jgi:flavin reductase (DIM6/NTAB) family NADH-FMN oxidoreductase RutF|uniref:Protein containing FMN-binding split barrel domain n=2 Tax=Nonlabens dokdonensis TaxID=328515 RepID=L7WAZ2_NONDD|nr:flavin reductase [Nonlabens dokdonensis]AGC77352.1 protein containing FMN-binding split barrel domain [Nonlabens dokdonensis DSW-6]PZX40879.1 flavin reductase (DIM6/NTAB) family NADH-FMN oxidoreductase RutF [Nonlabens dokdonensis]
MKHINLKQLQEYDRFYRGNLVNSITGFKSANLLATRSKDGIDNVAVFSSVTHLGSNPALFSFVQRPLGHGVGHTYYNLKETGKITLNHLPQSLIDRAHQSSAKYDESISEFEELGIEKLEREGFSAPFIKDAPVQLAAEYVNEYYLEENRCILVICKITDIFLHENHLAEDGWVDLGKAGTVTINGLDGYATAKVEKRLSYAQVDKDLEEISMKTGKSK